MAELSAAQQRSYRRIQRDTVDALGLQSARELSDAQRDVIRNFAIQQSAEKYGARGRDVAWNGPRARWLAMTGRRPIREHVEIGEYKKRGRVMQWEEV